MTMYNKWKYDFSVMWQGIKLARLQRGWIREELAQEIDLSPRFIMSIENKDQHPSFQVFLELMRMFNISVDQFLFVDTGKEKSKRRQLDAELYELRKQEYIVMTATAKGQKEK